MAGPFVANTWTTGDYITQTKMRQHVTNEEYLRERSDFLVVATEGTNRSNPSSSSSAPDVTVSILWDGNVLGLGATVTGGNGAFKIQDQSLGSPTVGLHTVQLRISFTFGGIVSNTTPLKRIYLPRDIAYVTVWGDIDGSLTGPASGIYTFTAVLDSPSIIFTRAAQGW